MIGPVDFVGLEHVAIAEAPWRQPLDVLAGLADRDGVVGLISDGGPEGRWSFVMAGPDRAVVQVPDGAPGYASLRDLPLKPGPGGPLPPFAGGWVGVASYDLGARRLIGRSGGGWPDLILMRFSAVVAFDHASRRAIRIGRGSDAVSSQAALAASDGWLSAANPADPPPPPAASWREASPSSAYRAAVADVVRRIGEGELFQANIGRVFEGRLSAGRDPFDVFLRSALSGPAPYAAWLRFGDRALVSNSPERFLRLDDAGRLEALPIKGTAPRGLTPEDDAASAARLLASAKDRAENLMIVDLMRNDLARVSEAGGVTVAE
ncbi:MAG: chorismate-binding protein, partial [Brevundimonas sp.]